MAESVEVDYDANTAVANAHTQVATEIRQGADTFAAGLTEWSHRLGDMYGDVRDAYQQALIPAMTGAHYRLADHHDAHAAKLTNKVNPILADADATGAAGIGSIDVTAT
jgi:hypothetical protein